MARPKTLKRDLAEEACAKHPQSPSLTLAKKIYKENPELYTNLEDARYFIRMVRGKAGDLQRKKATDKTLFDKGPRPLDPFGLPESFMEVKKPFKIPKASKKVLILSDIHIPYQDNNAIIAACEEGLRQGVDTVYLNGDILDFHKLSNHEKDPNKRSMSEELEAGRTFLAWLREAFPTQTIYYITGNHEFRIERYLRVKAPELLDCNEFKIDVLLRLREFGIINIPHRSKVYFGKLLVEHGDKLLGAGGVNPARTLLLKFKRPVICGHFHRTTSANSKVYDSHTDMAWSTGCLCELEPNYMEVNEHNHGAAIVDIESNGSYKVNNFLIIDGKVY
jgi:predicted phosphodiesterase